VKIGKNNPPEARNQSARPPLQTPFIGHTSERATFLLLESARSIMHDTRNRLTGISLCLSAWSKTVEPCPDLSAREFAIFKRGLRALEGLCSEFAGIETAIAFETSFLTAPDLVRWYRDYLSRMGFRATVADRETCLALPRKARGHAARALVQLSRLFHNLRATHISIEVGYNGGASTITLRFRTATPFETLVRSMPLRTARALVESGEGELEISRENGDVVAKCVFRRAGDGRP
jgi:hypothetical protein